MYDQAYLRTVARVVSQETIGGQEEFAARATPWLPTKTKELGDKTKVLVFPLEEDWDFVWQEYLRIVLDRVRVWRGARYALWLYEVGTE